MMMGIHFMDEVPFKDVYIHALVRDEHGKKMSKSTGNVIDPLTMIDKYGCDSLRFTLTSFAAMGRDIKLSEARIEGYRHFINKIWNAARFTLMHLEESDPAFDPAGVTGLHHKWILSRLEKTKKDMAAAVTGYRFNECAQIMYKFVWNEFCDWYVELIKPELYGEDEAAKGAARACLRQVLSEILLLLHPVVPFVTQEIWTCIPGLKESDIALAAYPAARPECEDDEAEGRMVFLQELITSVRNIRAELGIAPGLKLKLLVKAGGADGEFVLAHAADIAGQARLEEVQAGDDLLVPKGCATAVVGGYEIFVPLEGAVDFETELARLDKELGKVGKDLDFVTKKLANKGFVANAPAAVVEKEKAKAAEFGEKKEKLEQLKNRLQELMG